MATAAAGVLLLLLLLLVLLVLLLLLLLLLQGYLASSTLRSNTQKLQLHVLLLMTV